MKPKTAKRITFAVQPKPMHTLPQLTSGELKGTKSLKLSGGLTQFPLEILDLADTLEILDLSGNQLTHLPEEFAQLQHLKIAFFSENPFTEFPAVLAQCPKLEMIGFKACRLQTVPENAIPKTTRWLILTDNQITQLPTSISLCTNMQKLMLAGNRLTELPPEMAALQNLELLRISANNLTELPEWLFRLPRLSWLAFSGNPCQAKRLTQPQLQEIPWAELEVRSVLGEGASGLISLATWRRNGQAPEQVAVKVFKGAVTSDGLPQDEMEASVAAGQHSNLVQVLGKITGHPAQKQGLVLALIPAGYKILGNPPTFETCTRDTFPAATSFSLKEIIQIVTGIASVAAHLHQRGLLHGDLYAHNTLINESAHPLLSDFGAATVYGTAETYAAALEKLEVRAFGCLLEDVLNHGSSAPAETLAWQQLQALMQDCLQPEVHQRPTFDSVVNRVQKLAQN
ncbi:leucine-rich repeat-containing protein kinase family protein [Rufibacter sp. LB8]|uniref:leucine-rich repeat-containing protein kinase family protein n=1 Tax=Rufibacter sp. LB8 TaxID=2777781 RepID=UPI001CEF8168|nr:leucine-rich repeat-containing protein kinase family protein [Rufibacter sp. LB8]